MNPAARCLRLSVVPFVSLVSRLRGNDAVFVRNFQECARNWFPFSVARDSVASAQFCRGFRTECGATVGKFFWTRSFVVLGSGLHLREGRTLRGNDAVFRSIS